MSRPKVLIAGGGPAGLEALLALHAIAPAAFDVELLAPDPLFRLRPLSVAEPFQYARPREIDLAEVALQQGATFLRDTLIEVDGGSKLIRTGGGRSIAFDYLLIAVGARAGLSLPGSVPFWDSSDRGAFAQVVDELATGKLRSMVLAVPDGVTWSLGAYELAMLTADRLKQRHVSPPPQLTVVTPEAAPLSILGENAVEMICGMLARLGVAVIVGDAPVDWRSGQLSLPGRPPLPCDRVVSLPRACAPDIEGMEQDEDGFLRVDRFGSVIGADDIYAAGDVTNYPIKQGGIATQGADAAASAIAEDAGADVERTPFIPVLRAAILTPWGPRFMVKRANDPDGIVSKSPLWAPPSKIAGKHLTPFLSMQAGYRVQSPTLVDTETAVGDVATPTPEREDAVKLALTSADADAKDRRFRQALRWLEVAEDLDLYLPASYESKRTAWRAFADDDV